MKIKFVGFLKEQDKNISTAKYMDEMFIEDNYDLADKESFVLYMQNAYFLIGTMSYIYDDEGKPIGSSAYFTDGDFVWPVYYPYYIKKYKNYKIDDDFFSFVKSRKFIIRPVQQDEIDEIESLFLSEWSRKNTKNSEKGNEI